MMKKTVNIFDAETGEFSGTYEAQESPLELGVFICPTHSTDDPLPSLAKGEKAFRIDGAWVVRAAEPEPEAIPPTQEQIIAQYERAIDAHLDSVAKQHRYDNRFTFAIRAGYFGPYQSEAIAFAQWMDDCNVKAFDRMSRVLDGVEPLPTIEALISELPVFIKT